MCNTLGYSPGRAPFLTLISQGLNIRRWKKVEKRLKHRSYLLGNVQHRQPGVRRCERDVHIAVIAEHGESGADTRHDQRCTLGMLQGA